MCEDLGALYGFTQDFDGYSCVRTYRVVYGENYVMPKIVANSANVKNPSSIMDGEKSIENRGL